MATKFNLQDIILEIVEGRMILSREAKKETLEDCCLCWLFQEREQFLISALPSARARTESQQPLLILSAKCVCKVGPHFLVVQRNGGVRSNSCCRLSSSSFFLFVFWVPVLDHRLRLRLRQKHGLGQGTGKERRGGALVGASPLVGSPAKIGGYTRRREEEEEEAVREAAQHLSSSNK